MQRQSWLCRVCVFSNHVSIGEWQTIFSQFLTYITIELCIRLILDLDDLRLRCLLIQSDRRFEGVYCPPFEDKQSTCLSLHYARPQRCNY
jgi:hypothetical protein